MNNENWTDNTEAWEDANFLTQEEYDAEKLITKCETLCSNITHATHRAFPHTAKEDYATGHDFSIGKKYIKIVRTEQGLARSVWGFINIANENFKIGDVLMASGWSKPALNKARGNLFEGYQIAVNSSTHRIHGPDYLV